MNKLKPDENKLRTYYLFSVLCPIILLFPVLMASNLLGAGVMAGEADYLPKILQKYAPYRQGENSSWITLCYNGRENLNRKNGVDKWTQRLL